MPEDRRPVHPELRCQVLHTDALAVGSYQCGHPVGSETALHRQTGNQRVGRMDRRLTGALPQDRPQRWQPQRRAIYLRKRVTPGRGRWSCTVTTRDHSCSVFELGHDEDPVEGRPVLLMAEPAAFHVQTFVSGVIA